MVAAAATRVAEMRGYLSDATWPLVALAGVAVLAGKVMLDLRAREDEPALWRAVLSDAFGEGMRSDAEVARQARMAIEFRVRLAQAEAEMPRSAAAEMRALIPQLDAWLEALTVLARKVASERGEARFQQGLSGRSRTRLSEVQAQANAASDPAVASQLRATAASLDAQIAASDAFAGHVARAQLRLEQGVAAFGALCSQIALALTGTATAAPPSEITATLTRETQALMREIGVLTRAEAALPPSAPV